MPLEDYPKLTPEDTREFIYSILTTEQRRRLETDLQLDFAYVVPGQARFRVNAYFQRGAVAAAFRLIPCEIVPIDELGLPPVVHELTRKPRGHRARHRPDRLGQVDLARGDDRRDQPHARGAHHHDRGPDRVRARAPPLHDQPARARQRRDQLRRAR